MRWKRGEKEEGLSEKKNTSIAKKKRERKKAKSVGGERLTE